MPTELQGKVIQIFHLTRHGGGRMEGCVNSYHVDLCVCDPVWNKCVCLAPCPEEVLANSLTKPMIPVQLPLKEIFGPAGVLSNKEVGLYSTNPCWQIDTQMYTDIQSSYIMTWGLKS